MAGAGLAVPAGGSDRHGGQLLLLLPYFNPRSPWGERRPRLFPAACTRYISTHAPRGGSDGGSELCRGKSDISIHAPRGGSDFKRDPFSTLFTKFQSTLPVGGAAGRYWAIIRACSISIHAPRGGSDFSMVILYTRVYIFQSTLPVGGATSSAYSSLSSSASFQSTLPVGGATGAIERGGSAGHNFNPRSPWGERPAYQARSPSTATNFNPRSPWGERPTRGECMTGEQAISIHAPRGGSDGGRQRSQYTIIQFQSTLPVGGATCEMTVVAVMVLAFQSTLPVGGATTLKDYTNNTIQFQSTLPVGGATRAAAGAGLSGADFNPRSPWGERLRGRPSGRAPRHFNPRSPWGERRAGAPRRRLFG